MRSRSLLLFFALAAAPPAFAADPVFNPQVLHETRLVMDPADWQSLRENFRSNQYYAANISFDGEVFEHDEFELSVQGLRGIVDSRPDDVAQQLRRSPQ